MSKILSFSSNVKHSEYTHLTSFVIDVDLTLENKKKITEFVNTLLKKEFNLTYEGLGKIYYEFTLYELECCLSSEQYVLSSRDHRRHYLFPVSVQANFYSLYNAYHISEIVGSESTGLAKMITLSDDHKRQGASIWMHLILDCELTNDCKIKLVDWLQAKLKDSFKLTYESKVSNHLYYTFGLDELERVLTEKYYILGTRDEKQHYLFPISIESEIVSFTEFNLISDFIDTSLESNYGSILQLQNAFGEFKINHIVLSPEIFTY